MAVWVLKHVTWLIFEWTNMTSHLFEYVHIWDLSSNLVQIKVINLWVITGEEKVFYSRIFLHDYNINTFSIGFRKNSLPVRYDMSLLMGKDYF